jgi:acetyl esterase/lipase
LETANGYGGGQRHTRWHTKSGAASGTPIVFGHSLFFDHIMFDETTLAICPNFCEPWPVLAPAIVATADFDPLRDEGESYAAALEVAGNVVDLRQFGSLVHPVALMDARRWLRIGSHRNHRCSQSSLAPWLVPSPTVQSAI